MKKVSLVTEISQFYHMAPCKIGFLGGSFNPIHDGHIALAEHVLENFVDHVVICPHSLHPDKKGILIPIEHRMEMILILKDIARFSNRIHMIHPEFIHGTHGQPFVSLCRDLRSINIETSIICGTDCFSRSYYPDLCAMDHYVGIRVADHCKEKIQKMITGKTVFFETPFPALSSTKVRSLVSEKKMTVIHQHLREYIRDNKLFGMTIDEEGFEYDKKR